MRCAKAVITAMSALFALFITAGGALAQSCTIGSTPLAFGYYDSAFPKDTAGDITLNCDSPVPYTLRIDPGTNSGGSFNPRVMSLTGGSSSLTYNLYTDIARTRVWGDGTNNTYTVNGTYASSPAIHTVYGRVPEGQSVTPGTYSDYVTITVEW